MQYYFINFAIQFYKTTMETALEFKIENSTNIYNQSPLNETKQVAGNLKDMLLWV